MIRAVEPLDREREAVLARLQSQIDYQHALSNVGEAAGRLWAQTAASPGELQGLGRRFESAAIRDAAEPLTVSASMIRPGSASGSGMLWYDIEARLGEAAMAIFAAGDGERPPGLVAHLWQNQESAANFAIGFCRGAIAAWRELEDELRFPDESPLEAIAKANDDASG
ncbi:MAG TPA: hypothetical protein VHB99_08665 [Pirellulales bacterium]|nr:hypothetical protein [Pirellulales bacterium]